MKKRWIIGIVIVSIILVLILYFSASYFSSTKVTVKTEDEKLLDSTEVYLTLFCKISTPAGEMDGSRYEMIATKGSNGIYHFPSKLMFKFPLEYGCKKSVWARESNKKLWSGPSKNWPKVMQKSEKETTLIMIEFDEKRDFAMIDFKPTDFSKFDKIIN